MKITINEIANRAGVSKATVSRVLNKSKPVSEDVKKRVLEVIESTNFKPNATARSLSLKKSHLVGIILPDLSNPVFSKIISGIEANIRDKEYLLLITATDFDVEMKAQHIQILKDKGVDGLILVTDDGKSDTEALLDFKKPVVMLGSDSDIDTIPVIKIDNYKATEEAVEYLIDIGHQRIGMIRGPLHDKVAGRTRYEAFKNVLDKYNLYDERWIFEGWYSFEHGYQGMEKILNQEDRPTAVFCASDVMAIGAMRCAVERGLNVPDDISIMGFDDVELAGMYNPSLTTIRQPFEEEGKIAIDLLIDMIETKNISKSINILPYELVIRQSTKACVR